MSSHSPPKKRPARAAGRTHLQAARWAAALLACVLALSLVRREPAHAQAEHCATSAPASGTYSATLCFVEPFPSDPVLGDQGIAASVTVEGFSPGVQLVVFYLDGQYLLTSFASPYEFVLPSDRFTDGTHQVEAEALMRDGFLTDRVALEMTFDNGVTTPPVNRDVFEPSQGRPAAPGRPFVVAAVGSGADGTFRAERVAEVIEGWDPNLFLYLGGVFARGSVAEFKNWYEPGFGRLREITNPTVGNQEYGSPEATGYREYWGVIPDFYSFDAAGWHFASINTVGTRIQDGLSAHDWLARDLTAHADSCTIAYFHYPKFTVSAQASASGADETWALLADHGVDVVLSANDHNYQRWQPLDGHGNVRAGGVTQFVVGTGGHGIQAFVRTDERLAKGLDSAPTVYGALRLELNKEGAAYQFVNTEGQALDWGSIPCADTSDATPPTPPVGSLATPTGGDVVSIAWDAATDNVGVVGYDIYRNSQLLASTGPLTDFFDRTTSRGVTYEYTVRARDGAGNRSSPGPSAIVTTAAGIFSDGFESGDLSSWTNVAGFSVGRDETFPGLFAARATSGGQPAFATRILTDAKREIYYRVWFKLLDQGVNSVYLAKLRTESGGSIMGLYVSQTGRLGYRNDFAGDSKTSTVSVSPNEWHSAQIHVRIEGATGLVEVWLDGRRIDTLSGTASLGEALVGQIQLGDNLPGKSFDVLYDEVAADISEIAGNTGPYAQNVSIALAENTPVTWRPVVRDTEGDPLTCTIERAPTNGQATLDTDCAAGTYTPNHGYAGPDSFTFRVSDGELVAHATVAVTVNPNSAPLAAGLSVSTTVGVPIRVTLQATDPDGDCPLSFVIVDRPRNGQIDEVSGVECSGGEANGIVVLTPDPGFAGIETFTYVATDPGGIGSNTAAVSVAVSPGDSNSTVVFPAVADATVNESARDENFGVATRLRIDGEPRVRGYLKFEVSGLTRPITRATLWVMADSDSANGYDVRATLDNNWSELGITFASAPTVYSDILGSTGALSRGSWATVDVTPVVRGNGTFSFTLTGASPTSISLLSREAVANAPHLLIDTVPVPDSPASSLTLSNLVIALELSRYGALLTW